MKCKWMKFLATAFLLSGSAYSHAAGPLVLTEIELDSISAGTYSEVYGAATADSGSVQVKTQSQAKIRPNGTQMAKSRLTVSAKGEGVEGYGYGESGDDKVVTSGEGTAGASDGKLRIMVVTKTRTMPDGTSVSTTKTYSMAMDRASGGKIISTSTNYARSL